MGDIQIARRNQEDSMNTELKARSAHEAVPRGVAPPRHRPIRAESVRSKIALRLLHDAELDGRSIKVAVDGDRVVLSGAVSTTAARGVAEDTAWLLPGVESVDNEITIR